MTRQDTAFVYGHLDVQLLKKEDGWNTEPFVLDFERRKALWRRGALVMMKRPVLGLASAIESISANQEKCAVNIKFCFEGMEESGSQGLEPLLRERQASFFSDVDFVCISDNYWLSTTKPCLTYGLRGLCYFCIEIECASKDLHSGLFGGSVHEAMTDLIYIMGQLVEPNGKILIPHIYKDVEPLGDTEEQFYEKIDFDTEDFRTAIDHPKLTKADKTQVLMSRWRYPSLSLHGIEGAFSGPGGKTVIPGKVVGKFSIRIVPNQTPQCVEKYVLDYLNELWKARNSPNKFKAYLLDSGKSWRTNPEHPNYVAAARATKYVYNVEPDLTREGGSIPITLTFEEVTGKNVLLLPMGASDDGAHSQNEKIDVRNYIEGTKLLAAYLYEISKVTQAELEEAESTK
ncbi:LOW QUALITY PROTEIN: cytosolic non-specific dipeptidase-like [Diaphorina citri]|uniref:LOW QUALITY PROTEIN: cytosolic non-specific dipeptidase-like n=1 Tax=Diaphorina citri TaxID=121845 RepID=A0A3Q0JA43_DIACI|nr:LOW QUALITY PROTEIN: cytosolic non-specific dipeptidase-like [Diaphorina citri]